MTISRLLLLTLLTICTAASAQGFPDKSKQLRILVPFGAGSGNDVIARAYARAISEESGQPTIVENKPGAEAVIGVEAAKSAAPDGYTILFGNSSTHVLNVHMLQKLPYDPVADFIPLSGVASVALVMNGGPSTKFRSVKEVVEAARANPGKLSYGSGTTSTRLAMEMLEHLAKVQLLSVPYKAMAQAAAALSGGEIDLLVTDVSTALPHYQAGRMRPLGTTGPKRLTALPDVPTLREQGISQYEFTAWSAMFVPARTPSPVVDKLRLLFQQAAQSKYVGDALALNSQEPFDMNTAQLNARIRTDLDHWGKVLRDLKGTAISPRSKE
ncbi:tripartite tricarboxylate transporter substrate binding protein [Variovorax sp. WS11]|uniref:Bug family tripartite tricarboxylate transporter substrate binding protein n=1 Tax=Variovorax sp. WS11 TaxID=1105204 RepID=UPI0013D9473A|nr:tripartite tricarboxylate transporter substrate binding protein [Variovorax sp. WS11]NDZ18795.1 tripartite tricarboxylate transporter substrate binding protein [Variovorax sp. WS11]